MTVTIDCKFSERRPLLHVYPQQLKAQRAFIRMDEAGQVDADCDGDPGSRRRPVRSTAECQQMNAIYDMLDELQPTADQLKTLWKGAVNHATMHPEDEAACQLFVNQLVYHVQRRIA